MIGIIESHWEQKAGKLKLAVVISPNTTATVFVPEKEHNYSKQEIGPGITVFESEID